MAVTIPIYGTFELLPKTVAFGTVITSRVDPYPGAAGGPRMVYTAPSVSGVPSYSLSNFGQYGAIAHITRIAYTSAGTAHALALMRPFNFSTVSADAAVSQAVIALNTDPGLYSTKYAYPTSGGNSVASVANNAIAANDYAMYQLADGTWIVDTVASVSGLNITMTTNIPAATTGGGVLKGSVFYFFGVYTDSDPATGKPHWTVTSTASVTQTWGDENSTILSGLHRGDPIIFYSSNGTATGLFEGGAGYYSPY